MPAPSHSLLVVYTEPGSQFTRDPDSDDPAQHHFETWHDTTHIPALLTLPRSGAQPLFLSCTRWVAVDGQSPTQLCLYDLASPSAVYDRVYLALIGRNTSLAHDDGALACDLSDDLPSDDESLPSSQSGHGGDALQAAARDVLERMKLVDRRVYEPLAHVCAPTLTAPSNADGWPDLDGESGLRRMGPWHGRYMSVVEVEMKKHAEGEFNRWFDEEHVPLLMHVPGWVRSRRFALKECLEVSSTSVVSDSPNTDDSGGFDYDNSDLDSEKDLVREAKKRRRRERKEERPPKYLVIHEWTSVDVFGSKEFRWATGTPWRAHVLRDDTVLRYDMRVFRLAGSWIGYKSIR